MFNVVEATECLVERGYCIVPFDDPLVNQCHRSFTDWFRDLSSQNKTENLSFYLPGEEEEPDLGLIAPRPGKDYKWYFHYNLFLREMIKQSGLPLDNNTEKLLDVYRRLYLRIYDLTFKVIDQLELSHGWSVLDSVQRSVGRFPQPYSASQLRSLWYPAVDSQPGAKTHIDRSLLTIHLGDQGGSLIKLAGSDDKVGEVISPGPGEAVIFFGVKVLWASRGQIEPLWHKSTTVPGQDRRALVSFWHTEVPGDYQVIDALESYRYFYREVMPAMAG